MTKKDYIIIARVLRATRSTIINSVERSASMKSIQKITGSLLEVIIKGFVFELKNDNPKFDEKRFLEACGQVSDIS